MGATQIKSVGWHGHVEYSMNKGLKGKQCGRWFHVFSFSKCRWHFHVCKVYFFMYLGCFLIQNIKCPVWRALYENYREKILFEGIKPRVILLSRSYLPKTQWYSPRGIYFPNQVLSGHFIWKYTHSQSGSLTHMKIFHR